MSQWKQRIRLNVGDIDRAASFYQALLGAPPSRRSSRSIVFDLDSPPLVLTAVKHLVHHARATGAARAPSPIAAPQRFALTVNAPRYVGEVALALRRAGVRLRIEDQAVEASDADGNAWAVRFVPSAQDRLVSTTGVVDADERRFD